MPYLSDRQFTDLIHSNVALGEIYSQLNWTEKQLDRETAENIDVNDGIDYVFTDPVGNTINVQERFREAKYRTYNDVTLRYRRDNNTHANRHESEFYKIKADYLTYGTINTDKNSAQQNPQNVSFIKYAIINLRVLFNQIEAGNILLQYGGNFSQIQNQKLIIPIKYNRDGSSSFVAFDVPQLHELFGDQGIILCQRGFY